MVYINVYIYIYKSYIKKTSTHTHNTPTLYKHTLHLYISPYYNSITTIVISSTLISYSFHFFFASLYNTSVNSSFITLFV